MANPWFLDLDGAKSGPYQTQEVLSLVAEGEVLPHHLISPTLKDGPWISVLEWRLSQANLVPSPTLTSQPNYKPAAPEVPVEVEAAAAAAAAAAAPPIHSPQNIPAPYIPPESVAKPSKKDPAAEMFDALHKSKQKREEKQIQSEKTHAASAQTDLYSAPPTSSSNNSVKKSKSGNSTFLRTLLAGVAISAFGFWLGQWFQKSAAPQAPISIATPTPIATPRHTEVTAETVAASPSPVRVMEDRSTDKITIRGRVAPKPISMPSPAGNPSAAEPEPSPSASLKDLKELQDLKKELQELKNLKEELRNSIHDDGFEPSELPENGAGEPANPEYDSRY